jgi:lysophospholipase L1-like esterase
MNFRTNIKLQKERNQIDYNSKLVLIGSCFSENISEKLKYFKFQTFSNPFGILFNPIAIENLILNAIHTKKYSENDTFLLNERWHCFDAHSDISSSTQNQLLQNLNSAIEETHQQLKNASHIIITLGTAWVYRFIETNSIVGNCHKVPQKKFLKEILSVDETSTSLQNICALIKDINPTATIIFTVSPVRHLKDGFVENTQSKAHLIAAIHQIININNQLLYFPSFEIMLDDLRDYRFYASDMLHPNETAINYIWEEFKHVWIDEKTAPILKVVDSIQKGIAHRPFNEYAEQHQQFLKTLQHKIKELQTSIPTINF